MPADAQHGLPATERAAYSPAQILDWLEVFCRRFFVGSQFMRSAQPNGPKVGSGGPL